MIGAPLWSFSNLSVSPVEGLLIASKPSSAPLIITRPAQFIERQILYFVIMTQEQLMIYLPRSKQTMAKVCSTLTLHL